MARAQSLGDREAELRRHLVYPRLNINSNPCENVIRPLCLGRRNWRFAGSGGGGVPMAALAGHLLGERRRLRGVAAGRPPQA